MTLFVPSRPVALQQAALLERMAAIRARGIPARPFNLSAAYRVRGRLDVCRLQAALQSVVSAHPALRSSFDRSDEGWTARIGSHVDVPLPVEQLLLGLHDDDEGASDAAVVEAVDDRVNELFDEPFNPTDTLRLRPRLLELAPDDHILVLVTDHIVTDDWSLSVINEHLALAYAGSTTDFIENWAYYEFVERQEKFAASPASSRVVEFWRQSVGVDGLDANTSLQFEQELPVGASSVSGQFKHLLQAPVAAAVRARAREGRHTVFALLMACLQTAVAEVTATSVVTTVVPHANRRSSRDFTAVGWYAHLVIHRVDYAGCRFLSDAIGVSIASSVATLSHAQLTMHHLVKAMTPTAFGRPRSATWVEAGIGKEIPASLPGLEVALWSPSTASAPYRAVVTEIEERGDELEVAMFFDAARFPVVDVRRLWTIFLGRLLSYAQGDNPELFAAS